MGWITGAYVRGVWAYTNKRLQHGNQSYLLMGFSVSHWHAACGNKMDRYENEIPIAHKALRILNWSLINFIHNSKNYSAAKLIIPCANMRNVQRSKCSRRAFIFKFKYHFVFIAMVIWMSSIGLYTIGLYADVRGRTHGHACDCGKADHSIENKHIITVPIQCICAFFLPLFFSTFEWFDPQNRKNHICIIFEYKMQSIQNYTATHLIRVIGSNSSLFQQQQKTFAFFEKLHVFSNQICFSLVSFTIIIKSVVILRKLLQFIEIVHRFLPM